MTVSDRRLVLFDLAESVVLSELSNTDYAVYVRITARPVDGTGQPRDLDSAASAR
jgi:hypothetical protein